MTNQELIERLNAALAEWHEPPDTGELRIGKVLVRAAASALSTAEDLNKHSEKVVVPDLQNRINDWERRAQIAEGRLSAAEERIKALNRVRELDLKYILSLEARLALAYKMAEAVEARGHAVMEDSHDGPFTSVHRPNLALHPKCPTCLALAAYRASEEK